MLVSVKIEFDCEIVCWSDGESERVHLCVCVCVIKREREREREKERELWATLVCLVIIFQFLRQDRFSDEKTLETIFSLIVEKKVLSDDWNRLSAEDSSARNGLFDRQQQQQQQQQANTRLPTALQLCTCYHLNDRVDEGLFLTPTYLKSWQQWNV